jgi:GT2 family glycosyltransferase
MKSGGILGGTMSKPLVHVLIINWNGLEHLEECFETLLAGSYPNVRFVLVDNASEDGSIPFVEEHFGVDDRVEILALPENLGWSGGNNEGIVRALDAGADYVFLINNDTATAPDALEKLVAAAEARPQAGAIAPKMLLYDTPSLLNSVGIGCSIIGSSWDVGVGRVDGPRWNETRQVLGVCGGAMFLRAEALRQAGLLPDFQIYLDDLDLCMRIWNAGYEIWTCPEAVVRHKFSATMGQGKRLRQKYYLNTRNRMRIVLRNFPGSHLGRVLPAFVLGECKAVGRGCLDGDWWKLWAHAKAWASSVGYIPTAWTERRTRRLRGMAECRFWDLIRHDHLFFPGAELPENGWYAPQERQDKTFRPISSTASANVERGKLRVAHANWYPRLGVTDIEVLANGKTVAELRTSSEDETVIDVPGGTLEFRARQLFEAEDTGERVDFGGWINLTPLS